RKSHNILTYIKSNINIKLLNHFQMKKSKLLSVAFLIFNFQLSIFNCCYAQPLTSAKQYPQQIQCDSAWYPHQFITSAEAEKILQHSIFLKDSLCDFKNGYLRYNF